MIYFVIAVSPTANLLFFILIIFSETFLFITLQKSHIYITKQFSHFPLTILKFFHRKYFFIFRNALLTHRPNAEVS